MWDINDSISQKSWEYVCLKAVQQDGMSLEYVTEIPEEKYKEICHEAIKNDPNAIQYVDKDELTETSYDNLCWYAVRNSEHVLNFIPPETIQNILNRKQLSRKEQIEKEISELVKELASLK